MKCGDWIDENNIKVKWCMMITKRGQRITAFECFHYECWREFWEESVRLKMEEIEDGRGEKD